LNGGWGRKELRPELQKRNTKAKKKREGGQEYCRGRGTFEKVKAAEQGTWKKKTSSKKSQKKKKIAKPDILPW